MTSYDAALVAGFFDDYGEREWTRFEENRTPAAGLRTHIRILERFVAPGDRVLDAGCGPGRFTIELARLGATVVALDISPGQLDLHRRFVADAGAEESVVERVVGDVVALPFADGSFDVVVCFGGPVSYAAEHAERAIAELVRVTRPGGRVVLSVMSLVGTFLHFAPEILDLARRDGVPLQEEILLSGMLPQGPDYGHLPMRLFGWAELEALLRPHGSVVAGAAAGLLRVAPEEPELARLVETVEERLCEEPGALGAGQHIVAVLERAA
jgi:SAM-dependent methyltransferase